MSDDKPWYIKTTTTPWSEIRAKHETATTPSQVGFVYLLKAGPYYKIGKTLDFASRVRDIKLQLPFDVEVVHKIETDDPSGIEAYWHRRFAKRRENGEWFRLSEVDVATFVSRQKM